MNRSNTAHSRTSVCKPRAFTLIELLVVITIIAVIIGITVPALVGASAIAKGSKTGATLNSLNAAVGQFTLDEGRTPGYFSSEDMGHTDNASRGLTGMQNIMLDLIGGPIANAGPGALQVGPISASVIDVDLSIINIGEGSRGYFTPNGNEYTIVEGSMISPDHLMLPDVVDAWGMPVLAWVENDLGSVMTDDSSVSDFAEIESDTSSGQPPARFYWNQNAAYLTAEALGTKKIDIAEESLIGSRLVTIEHLAALLGSPNSSIRSTGNYSNILPRVGRGAIVFQSAGSDNVYLAEKDKGYGAVGGEFVFGRNLTPKTAVSQGQYTRRDGTKGSIDIVDAFDDIVVSSGN